MLLPFVLLLFSATGRAHPYFVSLTEMRWNTEAKTIQLSVRIFTDDLEAAIQKLYVQHTDIQSGKERVTVKGLLDRYIREHLQVRIGGALQEFHFIGYETEEESTWSYLECTTAPTGGMVHITNTILFDFIEGQVNMIHCYQNADRKSTKLNQPEKEAVFSW